MGVDRVDLWQIHNLADPIEWDVALSPGGVIDAAVEARRQGLISWIGVTGHGSQMPAMHLRSLERFDFDSVLLPFNYLTMSDSHYASGLDKLSAVCQERDVAVQTIKSLALAPWTGRERTATTWYEPLQEQADIDLAVWWGLGRPGIFLNSTGDLEALPRFLDAASRFSTRPPKSAMDDLVARSQMQPLFV
jgi:predicted aldo/keto reductase-like oxidoreductase